MPLPARTDEAEALALRDESAAGVTGILRPVANAAEVVRAKAETGKLIAEALEQGRDYGIIPGTDRPTLLKAGAETIASAFGTWPRFVVVDREVEHNREIEWTKRRKRNGRYEETSGTSLGLYRFQVKCELVNRATGQVVGEGLGACSSLESKYIERPRDLENTILKMATKRALVAAVLYTFGLSDRFSSAEPSLDALRGKYHATVNEILAPDNPEERSELRRAFQRAHPKLRDSSAQWDAEEFIVAIETLTKSGRRAFEHAVEVLAGDDQER